MKNDQNESITECKLEDGRIVEYDLALLQKDELPLSYPKSWFDNFVYLGTGVIYRIYGVIQPEKYHRLGLHFYKRVK